MLFSNLVNHVSVSPSTGIGPTKREKKTLTSNSHPGPSFPLSLCWPSSISGAKLNAHMVYMGRK